MKILVDKYRIIWSNQGSAYGAIDIRDKAKNNYRFKSTDPNLLAFWADTLRNEKPVFFNTKSEVLYTGPEDPGEGED